MTTPAGVAEQLDHDLHVVEAITANLKTYLLGESIYCPLSKVRPAAHQLPQGTLGGLLSRLHRLRGMREHLTPEQRRTLEEAQAEADEQLKRWAVQAEQLAAREARARAGSWLRYVEELEAAPRTYAPEYPTQARTRTALALLLSFLGDAAGDATNRMRAADELLKTLPAAHQFVWPEPFRAAYPEREFWWLYLKPLPEEGD